MNEKNPLDNIKPKMIALPSTDAQLGQLIGELASENPRAIIIDFFQATIVVHPSGVGGKPKLTEESIPYLLSNFHIEMLDKDPVSLKIASDILKKEYNSCSIVFHIQHQKFEYELQLGERALWTKLIAPSIALIIQQKTDQSDWKIYGLQIETN